MKTVFDDHLMEWEAWATPAPGGLGRTGRVVFRCLTDRGVRPRALDFQEPGPAVEARLEAADPGTLRDMLSRAEPIR